MSNESDKQNLDQLLVQRDRQLGERFTELLKHNGLTGAEMRVCIDHPHLVTQSLRSLRQAVHKFQQEQSVKILPRPEFVDENPDAALKFLAEQIDLLEERLISVSTRPWARLAAPTLNKLKNKIDACKESSAEIRSSMSRDDWPEKIKASLTLLDSNIIEIKAVIDGIVAGPTQ